MEESDIDPNSFRPKINLDDIQTLVDTMKNRPPKKDQKETKDKKKQAVLTVPDVDQLPKKKKPKVTVPPDHSD